MVDRERAAQHLDALDRLLRDWRELAADSSARRLRSDRAFSQRVCYVLMAAIQTCLDLASLVIAERGLPRPASYRECFEILEKEGLLKDRRHAALLQEFAGFRNLLAHQYIRLDWNKVQKNLRRGAKALDRFRKVCAVWARK